MACANTALVYLAAGAGQRFGGNKLEAELDGLMLGLHAARMLAGFDFGWRFAVVSPGSAQLNEALADLGYHLLVNANPQTGLSHSLSLGSHAVAATAAQAMLVALGDMPGISAGHIRNLLAAQVQNREGGITASLSDGQKMPPAIFDRAALASLVDLTGDQGARALLRGAAGIAAPAGELVDIDTRVELNALDGARL
jgi:molybdenum cofactor cytidylyltransferase